MNSDTGQIREFNDGVIPEGWTELRLHSHVEFNGLLFQIIKINANDNEVVLRGIPKLKVAE